jgi:hypothetical protein
MTKEEYKDSIQLIEDNYTTNLKTLAIKFARENNPVQIGYMIEDDNGVILKVEKLFFHIMFGEKFPSCYYRGTSYTKKGIPKKIQTKSDTIYQCRIIKINNVILEQ